MNPCHKICTNHFFVVPLRVFEIMLYNQATFRYNFSQEWEQDLFEQALADIGFDSFSDSAEAGTVKTAYIPTTMFDEAQLHHIISQYEGIELLSVSPCEDNNWNEVWEAEHPVMELPDGIRIVPHCAFGAGHHETTSMLIERMGQTDMSRFADVLDNGCGTGILGIMAGRYGVQRVTMVDIDDKSVENTRENIALNRDLLHGTAFNVRQGDTPPDGRYDLILSNIHRNILLQQMPLYATCLNSGGELWISGFYEQDCPTLLAAASAVGLQPKDENQKGEWKLLVLYQPLTGQAE